MKNPAALRPAHLRQAATIPLNLARLVKSSAQLRRLAKVQHDEVVGLELQSVG
ncbi:MAG: hypothetical protein HC875_31750 [Anaerolineales bacterium]|nr:hypothetical protein [Anaerolineales bacterium]